MHLRLAPPRSARARALGALLLCLCAARGALAAPADPAPPAFSIALLGLASQPSGRASRGAGAGVAVGYRMTDQLALTADAARVFAQAGPFSTWAAGLRAVLDATPLSPYLAFSLVALSPREAAGASVATRTTAGAEVRVGRALALALEARALTPLSTGPAGSPSAGAEVALRMVLFPSLLR